MTQAITSSFAATVVLVHGAWADASSWRRVIRRLHVDGVVVVAVQNPTTSLADDVAATRRAIARIDGAIVLVGHSWGGTVITEVGDDPKIQALVYVAAFAPDAGQSSSDLVALHEAPPALADIVPDGAGGLLMTEHGWISAIAQDLPPAEARVLAATAPPLAAGCFDEKVTVAAWRRVPAWYVVSTDDRALSVALQRDLVDKLRAHSTEIAASHMSVLSMPDAIAAVVLSAMSSLS